jgi:hypothetical protein
MPCADERPQENLEAVPADLTTAQMSGADAILGDVAREKAATPVPEEQRTNPTPMEPDDALILWMLSLTPTQRLEVAQGFIDSIHALRDGARA